MRKETNDYDMQSRSQLVEIRSPFFGKPDGWFKDFAKAKILAPQSLDRVEPCGACAGDGDRVQVG